MNPLDELTMDELFSHIRKRYKACMIIGCNPARLVKEARRGVQECDIMGSGESVDLFEMLVIASETVREMDR